MNAAVSCRRKPRTSASTTRLSPFCAQCRSSVRATLPCACPCMKTSPERSAMRSTICRKASAQVVQTSKQTRDLTAQSRETVLGTAQGMNQLRGTIQETAKRIKRLGERSQEIGGIVKLIDTIAERTN